MIALDRQSDGGGRSRKRRVKGRVPHAHIPSRCSTPRIVPRHGDRARTGALPPRRPGRHDDAPYVGFRGPDRRGRAKGEVVGDRRRVATPGQASAAGRTHGDRAREAPRHCGSGRGRRGHRVRRAGGCIPSAPPCPDTVDPQRPDPSERGGVLERHRCSVRSPRHRVSAAGPALHGVRPRRGL